MFSEKELEQEVQNIIEAHDCEVRTAWLVNVVMANHPNIDGDDKDFYTLCAWNHVKTAVRHVLRRYEPEANQQEADEQIVLPGFERLQRRYHIERDGESCIVPIDQLTAKEIRSKIREYHAMAEGCRLHAAELERYLRQRDDAA